MARLGFLQHLQNQWWKVAPVELVDLIGKTVVVIGANVGLGFEASKHFASMNPKRLVLGCRSQERGQAALQAIQATGFKNAELALIDLAQFTSVSAFADTFVRENAQIDILVYNAAVAFLHYSPTKDGWEETIQVNHLSAMLLSILLLPCLLKAVASGTSPNPRLVIVGSDVHYWTKFSEAEVESDNILKKLSDENYCTSQVMRKRYSISKLLNVFFVQELTKRLPANSPVIVTVANPGYCKSELTRNFPFALRILEAIGKALLARTTEEGSRQLVWAAVGGVGREFELHGGYVSMANLQEVSDYALSDEGALVQIRAWDDSIEILSSVEPKFESTLREILSV